MTTTGTMTMTKATRKHQQYLKHGKGPVLDRMGSMRAGAAALGRNVRKLGGGGAGGVSAAAKKKYVVYGAGLVKYKGSSPAAGRGGGGGRGSPFLSKETTSSSVSEKKYGSIDEERPPQPQSVEGCHDGSL